nr:MAG TPA: hypothetical protein [Caudoviricetes sp.]
MIAAVAFNAPEAHELILLIPFWNPDESIDVSNFRVPS